MTYFMNTQIQAPIYAHYSTVDGDICDSTVITGCSFSNLTYNQWLSGSVLLYPLPGMDIAINHVSYTIEYADYTLLDYPPEAYYFEAVGGGGFPIEVTIFDAY